MTDETNVQGAESSDPLAGVTFIDETIIKKAPGVSAPAPLSSPIPAKSVPVSPTPRVAPVQTPSAPPTSSISKAPERPLPPPRTLPEIAPLMRDIPPPPKPVSPIIPPPVPKPVTPAPIATPMPPSAPQPTQVAPTPAPSTTPIPPQIPTPPVAPQVAVVPEPVVVHTEQKVSSPQFTESMQADMQKILAGVKLPERRAEATQQKQIPVMPIESVPGTAPAPLPETAPLAEKISAEAPSAPKPDSTNEHTLASVHTLKDDLQHVVRDKKISYVRAAALEEEKKSRRGASETGIPEKRSWASRALIAIVILFMLGGLALGAVFFVQMKQQATPQSPTTNSVMFAEQTVTFPLGNVPASEVKRSLAEARARGTFTLGAMTRIVPTISEGDASTGNLTERQATFREFMAHIGTTPSEEFFRAVSDEFFFGIHTVDENAPVIVVPVSSYENAFAGMLAWERSMNAELSPLYTPLPSLTLSPEGLPVERTFSDELMRNYDVRALKDDAGAIQLFYSFPTRNILIIAESPYSFTESLSRLRAERKL